MKFTFRIGHLYLHHMIFISSLYSCAATCVFVFPQVMCSPLLIIDNVCQITKINRLTIQKRQQTTTHIITLPLSRLMLSQKCLYGREVKEVHLAGFAVIEILLGDLMNPNEEFASSNVAEVTGSSKSSFRIGVTLALQPVLHILLSAHLDTI